MSTFAIAAPQPSKDLLHLAHELGANTLVSLVQRAGLSDALKAGNFTIFAPTDAAFANVPDEILAQLRSDKTLLANVLKYHVVQGNIVSSHIANDLQLPSLVPNRKIRINVYDNARVVTATGSRISLVDAEATNGIIHLIEKVMYPIPELDALHYLGGKPNFTQLVYNSIRADVSTELQGGPLTIFAPMDVAFYDLPAGYLNSVFLNLTSSKALMNYHIVKGTFYSAGLRNGENIQTDNGQDVTVNIAKGNVMIETARVIQADISITNGVIHVIDKVLLPESHINVPPIHEIVG